MILDLEFTSLPKGTILKEIWRKNHYFFMIIDDPIDLGVNKLIRKIIILNSLEITLLINWYDFFCCCLIFFYMTLPKIIHKKSRIEVGMILYSDIKDPFIILEKYKHNSINLKLSFEDDGYFYTILFLKDFCMFKEIRYDYFFRICILVK